MKVTFNKNVTVFGGKDQKLKKINITKVAEAILKDNMDADKLKRLIEKNKQTKKPVHQTIRRLKRLEKRLKDGRSIGSLKVKNNKKYARKLKKARYILKHEESLRK